MSENVWLVWRLQSPLQLLSAARPEMLLKLKFMKLIWVVSTSQLKSAWTHQSRKICFQSRAHQLFHQLERAYEGRLLSSGKCSIQCFFFRLCCSKSFTCFWKIVSFTLGMQKSAYRDRNRLVLGMGICAAQIHMASFHRLSYGLSHLVCFLPIQTTDTAQTGTLLELMTRQAFRSFWCKILISDDSLWS